MQYSPTRTHARARARTHANTHTDLTELVKYDFRVVENFVFLKGSEGFVKGEGEDGCDELILPHHWSHRNVNLLVRRLEWII